MQEFRVSSWLCSSNWIGSPPKTDVLVLCFLLVERPPGKATSSAMPWRSHFGCKVVCDMPMSQIADLSRLQTSEPQQKWQIAIQNYAKLLDLVFGGGRYISHLRWHTQFFNALLRLKDRSKCCLGTRWGSVVMMWTHRSLVWVTFPDVTSPAGVLMCILRFHAFCKHVCL